MSETGKHTPGPWTTDPGKRRMWICRVGNNSGDPEVWSTFETKIGEPWPFGDKAADALLIAAAPGMAAELSQLELEFESFVECGTSPSNEWLRDNLASIRAIVSKATGTPMNSKHEDEGGGK